MSEPKPVYKHGGRRPGAGRKGLKAKAGEPLIELTIRLTKQQHDYLQAVAAKRNTSIADVIRNLIEFDRSWTPGSQINELEY